LKVLKEAVQFRSGSLLNLFPARLNDSNMSKAAAYALATLGWPLHERSPDELRF
jgi:hypothetical protein